MKNNKETQALEAAYASDMTVKAYNEGVMFMLEHFSSVLERLGLLEEVNQIYHDSYAEVLVTVEDVLRGLIISRSAFDRWKEEGLIRFVQKVENGVILVPKSEIARIKRLCVGVKNTRAMHTILQKVKAEDDAIKAVVSEGVDTMTTLTSKLVK